MKKTIVQVKGSENKPKMYHRCIDGMWFFAKTLEELDRKCREYLESRN